MKRILLPLLSMLLVAVGFSACSDDDSSNPSTKATLSMSLTVTAGQDNPIGAVTLQ